MQFKKAGDYIIKKLKNELAANYVYHNIAHTQDVYKAAAILGKQEGVSKYEMNLLLTAALYHDSGFLRFNEGHEEESCRIAATTLPRYGYTESDINLICGLIRATRMPQSPKTLLERIMVDADLDYLGREDFNQIAGRLFNELNLSGRIQNQDDWNKLQLDFMESHRYFTQSAINLRLEKKKANMAQIKAQLVNYTYKSK